MLRTNFTEEKRKRDKLQDDFNFTINQLTNLRVSYHFLSFVIMNYNLFIFCIYIFYFRRNIPNQNMILKIVQKNQMILQL